MAHRILVVGGGYAGALCAIRTARKTRSAAGVEVVLANASPWFVERIRLHEDAAGGGRARRPLASLLEGTGVRLRVGAVAGIDLARRRAFFERSPGGSDEASPSEPFDHLVLATGSVVATGGVHGAAHAWSSATEDRALALRAHLAGVSEGAVTIVGAGLTGIELASELATRRPGLRVTLLASGEVAALASTAGRTHVRRVLASQRVELREDSRVVAIEEHGVVLASGEALPSDATVWCGGLQATPLAREAGLEVDDSGRALVGARLRSTSYDFVHVIGDAARVEMRSADGSLRPLRMACQTAMPQGAFCADDLARELMARPPVSFAFGYTGHCMSLGRHDALIQLADRRDVAGSTWIGGRFGAFMKEMVCRYTTASLALERRGLGYSWLRPPALAAGSGSADAPPALATRSP